jgi:hypothetical protein
VGGENIHTGSMEKCSPVDTFLRLFMQAQNLLLLGARSNSHFEPQEMAPGPRPGTGWTLANAQ